MNVGTFGAHSESEGAWFARAFATIPCTYCRVLSLVDDMANTERAALPKLSELGYDTYDVRSAFAYTGAQLIV